MMLVISRNLHKMQDVAALPQLHSACQECKCWLTDFISRTTLIHGAKTIAIPTTEALKVTLQLQYNIYSIITPHGSK